MIDDARRIAQDFLDRTGEATIRGDVDATLDYCDIPCTLESMQGRAVATNTAEMRAICVAFIDRVKLKRLTYMVRNCLEAVFKDEETIWARYQTRYVTDGNLLTEDPYFGSVILRRKGDRWKVSAMQFAASSDSPVNAVLSNCTPKGEASAENKPSDGAMSTTNKAG
ncbi:nuclear transport factor 2 family protein [Pseudorhodobacter sp.]|uniref:nuclear transport factor 2 family protein n=1 Tax=Pseudorhodobacter sp. TaxID=1934400 RepID=UPI002AFE9B49|nr:nuclear transport factor 2 family protein [Pseudorhodobacter sp.]